MDFEPLERGLIETEDGQDESPLTIDLAGLIENVPGPAREKVAYMADLAKTGALDLLGEFHQAFESADWHV